MLEPQILARIAEFPIFCDLCWWRERLTIILLFDRPTHTYLCPKCRLLYKQLPSPEVLWDALGGEVYEL